MSESFLQYIDSFDKKFDTPRKEIKKVSEKKNIKENTNNIVPEFTQLWQQIIEDHPIKEAIMETSKFYSEIIYNKMKKMFINENRVIETKIEKTIIEKKQFKIPPKKVIKNAEQDTVDHAIDILEGVEDNYIPKNIINENLTNIDIDSVNLNNDDDHAEALL